MQLHPRSKARAGIYIAAAVIGFYLMPHQAVSAERLYCFSDICLGDPPAILKTTTLNDLSRIADHKAPTVDLKTALPETSEADRKVLADQMGEDGRFLLDQKTLRIFLGVKGVCAPIAPFVALFTSDSGHLTSVEFDVIALDGEVRLGVKKIARAFRIKPGTPVYLALIADLSEKFGFKVGGEALLQRPGGIVVAYRESEADFQLSLALPALKNRNLDIASQIACEPKNRVKID